MDCIGCIVLFVGIIILYICYFVVIKKRIDYYDLVNEKMLEITKNVSYKDTECVYEILHYVRRCRIDRTRKSEFQRGVRKKIKYFESRDKVSRDASRRICEAMRVDI